jgi:transposase
VSTGLFSSEGLAALHAADLSPAGHQAVTVGVRTIDALSAQLVPLKAELVGISRHQPACRALAAGLYGVGPFTAVVIWVEMGDCRRFSSSADAVRHTGLDITVDSSDTHRKRGHLARQGPPALRWALYEAAKSAARKTSPDYDYYTAVRDRVGAHRATLSVARKLARRAHHILTAAGDSVLAA